MNFYPIHLLLKGDDLEDACISLEQRIQGSTYYSGCSEDGDVCYTIYTFSLVAIEEWRVTSKQTGLVRSAEILDW
jgi:hypothetical protein